MDRDNRHMTTSSSAENIKKVFRRMLEDKRAVQSYISENGTLEGFEDETIVFAKPL